MEEIRYISFLPGGNKTALVIEGSYSAAEKKRINDAIMNADPEIEQVGFLGPRERPSIQMAGGEFCGNATRSAALYYLQGKKGHLGITVNIDDRVACGVRGSNAWCGIPVGKGSAEKAAEGIWLVELSGISHLVVEAEHAAAYLRDMDDLKEAGFILIKQYGLAKRDAAGVIFLESLGDDRFKIHPVVWVSKMGSLFYETACGSGTVAAAIVHALQTEENPYTEEFLQPSGKIIRAETSIDNGRVTRAVISGPVETDFAVHTLNV